MKIQGEFLFQTFEEALNFVANPTNYEKANGITQCEKFIMLDTPDLKVVRISKSDKSNGIVIFFCNLERFISKMLL